MTKQELKKASENKNIRFTTSNLKFKKSVDVHLWENGNLIGTYNYKGSNPPFAVMMENSSKMSEWFENWIIDNVRSFVRECKSNYRFWTIDIDGIKFKGTL